MAVAQGAAVVSTTTTDGAVEANKTSYFCLQSQPPAHRSASHDGEIQRTDHVVSAERKSCKTITLK